MRPRTVLLLTPHPLPGPTSRRILAGAEASLFRLWRIGGIIRYQWLDEALVNSELARGGPPSALCRRAVTRSMCRMRST